MEHITSNNCQIDVNLICERLPMRERIARPDRLTTVWTNEVGRSGKLGQSGATDSSGSRREAETICSHATIG